MTGLTAVSLFAGIGGFDLALQRAGVHVAAAVEIDQAARGVLADRFPETTLFNDVREVTPDDLRAAGFVPERGILTGGFPCQDLSVAGRRAGLGGARSGLFWEIVRLAKALRPRWICLENVPGLLSAVCPCPGTGQHDGCTEAHPVSGGACGGGCLPAHGGAMGLVLGALADLGYGFAYRVLDAQHFGVPQRRRRVFIVGCLGDAAGPAEVLLEPEGRPGHLAPGGEEGSDTSGSATGSSGNRRGRDRRRGVVNSLTTSSVGGVGGADDNSAQAGHLIASALTAREGKGPAPSLAATGRPHVANTLTAGQSAAGVSRPGRRSEDDTNLVAHTLRADPGGVGQGHNTNYVAETLRSHPRPGSNSNGAIITHALTAEGADASEDGTGRVTPLVPMAFNPRTGGDMRIGYGTKPTALGTTVDTAVHLAAAVRRLTPLECERLQGFPDNWTVTSNGKPQADAARYRQCGNAVAVPVVDWIARRIAACNARSAESAARLPPSVRLAGALLNSKEINVSDLKGLAAEITERLREHFPDTNLATQQVLCLAEEAGEFVGAYRRWAGMARRTGPWEDVEAELADVVVTAFVTAQVLGIDLDAAVAEKTKVVFSRGWRDKPAEVSQ